MSLEIKLPPTNKAANVDAAVDEYKRLAGANVHGGVIEKVREVAHEVVTELEDGLSGVLHLTHGNDPADPVEVNLTDVEHEPPPAEAVAPNEPAVGEGQPEGEHPPDGEGASS